MTVSEAAVAPARVITTCPSCGTDGLERFYDHDRVPSHSCLLMPTHEAALAFPRGEIALGFCGACGFIANAAVDASLQAYSSSYEETQGFSPRFREFAERLALRWVEKYDLRGKHIVEIGCGKGEFLSTMCRLAGARGTGIDPAIVPDRIEPGDQQIDWLCEYYSDERHAALLGEADAIVCRHTLEHIPAVGDFMRRIRRGVGDRTPVILFELPDAVRVLREQAFWDIYYEHCSYFSPGSLARLFRMSGFEPLALELDYDDQYILLEARPADGRGALLSLEEDVDQLRRDVAHFKRAFAATRTRWNDLLADLRASGRRVALWGSGSKAVAFLSTLDAREEVGAVVDINPFRHGKYLAGIGHQISSPAFLREYRPDVVIAMNPIYRDEIAHDLRELRVAAELLAV